MESRFYWLKLKRDFFKRHDIQIIENMENGKDYILFYLKLLCESVDHEGNLRFSEEIPYNENMLSTITNTNIDIVRSAIKIFSGLGMMEILDDGTYFMNEVNRMIGSAVDNDNANRQRRFRERKKQEISHENDVNVTQTLLDCYESVTKNNESKSKSKSKSKSIEKDNVKKKKFAPPSIDEVKEYLISVGSQVDAEAFVAFYESKDWYVGKTKMVSWKHAIVTWEKRDGLKRIPIQNIVSENITEEYEGDDW